MAMSIDQKVDAFLAESRTNHSLIEEEFAYHANSGNFGTQVQSANAIPVVSRTYTRNMAVADRKAEFEHAISINSTTKRDLARQYILSGKRTKPSAKYVVSKKDIDTLAEDLSRKPIIKDKLFEYHLEGGRYGNDALVAYKAPRRSTAQVQALNKALSIFEGEVNPANWRHEALLGGFATKYVQNKMQRKIKTAAAVGILGLAALVYGAFAHNPLFRAGGGTAAVVGGGAYAIQQLQYRLKF